MVKHTHLKKTNLVECWSHYWHKEAIINVVHKLVANGRMCHLKILKRGVQVSKELQLDSVYGISYTCSYSKHIINVLNNYKIINI